ncbi:aminodeoxychorismate/anthranilate synthase component II [Staphylococcus gallinarum]|uniref:anthranilate synthase component II n=1 Tax=Staphylococcus gallinarum TaxID=1293 RepID=UPI001E2D1DC3|nr:aminodeoxychorismate/anthranilate synthase component II [Staphylococcus gallinarum]MCD8786438.1 aminodeoxychorismate/anthranilate synthase component II [Staphylococcus gallinarum]MCD8900852.1 aminodeoxychorismate/anthranilate synthase component II [Staphylococcus gallinarum]MCD8901509.1 aminodeoxychorismate/anthranilate synthase component II [Staphylococcus gallinarum]MCQ9288848.1 aminodeoxychorismate/anthranilate synthase component II [Staphylococcus gallinarum]MEB6238230.1 aminodeoxychori
MILMIDNKDSFTYNIVDYIKQIYKDGVCVIDVTALSIAKIQQIQPKGIVISPGPGTPEDYPILTEVMDEFAQQVPILGVCLGFQHIITYYGGDIVKSYRPIHGHTTVIEHTGEGIFKDLPQSFKVMRYHSLMAQQDTMPSQLKVTARNDEAIIMAIEHQSLPIYGVQYHPESILSEYGIEQLKLFIEIMVTKHANPV